MLFDDGSAVVRLAVGDDEDRLGTGGALRASLEVR